MAKDLKTWALFGPPLGRTWQPTADERQRFPEVHWQFAELDTKD